MSNLARKYQQQYSSEPKRQANVHVKTVPASITPGEKLLFMLFIVFIAFLAIKIVAVQAAVYEANKNIQDIQTAIQEQEKHNADLEMQIGDLNKYDRIWNKAKESGLSLNENNIKVVEKK